MIAMHFLKPEALSLRPFIALPPVAIFGLKTVRSISDMWKV